MKTQCLEHPQWDVPQSCPSPRPSSPLSHPQQGTAGAPVFPFNEYQPLAEGTSKSERQDADWARITSTSASDPNDLSSLHSSSDYGHGPKGGASAYVLGSLTGSWRGTLMVSLFLLSFRIIIIPPSPYAPFYFCSVGHRHRTLGASMLIVCMTMWHRHTATSSSFLSRSSFLLTLVGVYRSAC